MKKIVLPLIYTLLPLLSLLQTTPLGAQTRVESYSASEPSDNSVVYALPRTMLYALVTVEEEHFEPGPLALYAPQYLGVSQVGLQPDTRYRLVGAEVGTYGVADSERRFAIRFKRGTDAPFVRLTREGVLCAINIPCDTDGELPRDERIEEPLPVSRMDVLSSLSAEYIQATTPSKKAELAAREIYRIRESRASILSGDAEQPFPDGEAMRVAISGLDTQERALTQQFIGTTRRAVERRVVRELPAVPAEGGKEPVVAFRFSPKLGLLDKQDLRGEPVYLKVEVVEQAPVPTEQERKRFEKRLDGIVYVMPGKVRVSLVYEGRVLASNTCAVAQMGRLEVLEGVVFENKKQKVGALFYPQTGALKKIQTI